MQYILKKSLGQHFLHDDNVCRKIVGALQPCRQLVEVGPGGGAITKYLKDLPDTDFRAIEVDEEKLRYLEHHYPELKGRILLQDVLKAPPPFEGRFSVIGNFPYNISSPIMFHILEWGDQVDEVIGMFQKEVAQRIAAGPGSKTYGILSVLMQAYFKTEYLFDVQQTCFTPPPKVMSGVIRFTNAGNQFGVPDKAKFFLVVKTAFNQRRKTLRNALKGLFPASLLHLPVLDKRAEQLSVPDFVSLTQQYLNA